MEIVQGVRKVDAVSKHWVWLDLQTQLPIEKISTAGGTMLLTIWIEALLTDQKKMTVSRVGGESMDEKLSGLLLFVFW